MIYQELYENDVRTLGLVRPKFGKEVLVIGEPLMGRCYEIEMDYKNQRFGPEIIGQVANEEVHNILFEFNNVWTMGPKMFTSGKFIINQDIIAARNNANYRAEFQNTNLQITCIFQSENKSMTVAAGIWYEKKDANSPEINNADKKPQIRLKLIYKKPGYRLLKELYLMKHKDMIFSMLAIDNTTKMLTFGLDCKMKTWIVKEDKINKLGTLKSIDEWFIKDEAITCAKLTRGGRYVIAGSFRGNVLLINPKKKFILKTYSLLRPAAVNSVEEGFNDPDDSYIYAIADITTSIEKFRLTEKEYNTIYGGIKWPTNPYSNKYIEENPRYAANMKLVAEKRFSNYQEYYKKQSDVLQLFKTYKK